MSNPNYPGFERLKAQNNRHVPGTQYDLWRSTTRYIVMFGYYVVCFHSFRMFGNIFCFFDSSWDFQISQTRQPELNRNRFEHLPSISGCLLMSTGNSPGLLCLEAQPKPLKKVRPSIFSVCFWNISLPVWKNSLRQNSKRKISGRRMGIFLHIWSCMIVSKISKQEYVYSILVRDFQNTKSTHTTCFLNFF